MEVTGKHSEPWQTASSPFALRLEKDERFGSGRRIFPTSTATFELTGPLSQEFEEIETGLV
jgi:hypothetical protein